MGESFLIALREGFEASLIVAIVLAFVRRQAPERARDVWLGTGAAIGLSVVIGLVLHATIDGLEGVARARTFAFICLAAAALLTWMIFWMRAHARALKGELEGKADAAIAAGSGFALGMVAFASVLREGLETALFLISTTTGSGNGEIILGTILGLAVATVLGVAVYHGSKRFNMRVFFQITGVLIILFAAGLMSRFVLFLQATGDIGTWNDAVYNLTRYAWLTVETQTGRFLGGIFGWDPRPSIEQTIAYFGYLIPVLWLYFRAPKPKAGAVSSSTPAPTKEPAPVS